MPLIKRIPLCGIEVILVRPLRIVMDPCSIDHLWLDDPFSSFLCEVTFIPLAKTP